ncbi:TIGR03761 family integrating conjugative element protein [Vibrio sinensis]|uniref:TIGR03761 family integrating conjugative element protein n=1 Tax=Vibrio sinensis TaxID=2302434 RepID=A0A3A6QKT9_9VIBR|nr:TIGR03761 family integrating conjugative element protein [Vibrio sinensis]RJX68701.1 TIGR03761 family integrating conjugative element protein [Vibrio sinensis]
MKQTRKNKRNNFQGLGALASEAQMTVHSVETIRLWNPGNKAPLPSIGRFLTEVSTLEYAARHDDPYADFALLELERMMNGAFTFYHEQLSTLPPMMTARLSFSECLSRRPHVKTLRIASRFGWRMMALVESFDVLMVRLSDVQFKAQITRSEFEKRRFDCIRKMESVLHQVLVHKHSGVTRLDMVQNTAKAQQAMAMLGPVPFEVLEELERAEYAPVIKRAS